MRRFLFFLLLFSIILFGVLQFARQRVRHDLSQPVSDSILSPSPTLSISQNQQPETFLFVPYWADLKKHMIENQYDNYIYFGITPGKDGIQSEAGAAHIEDFKNSVPEGKKTLLTLRMVDADTNTAILKDKALQQKIITQTIQIAKKNGFSGVVFDLEMSALPFDSLIAQINSFTADLGTAVKKENLAFTMLFYGDTLYRARPFDIKTLGSYTDKVLVMSYDFHKTRGNPGPNFPLHGKDTYGYDLSKMADDFMRVIPSEKIVVVFGMYGYDWVVDAGGKPTDTAVAITDIAIQKKFLDGCSLQDCKIVQDPVSAETKVNYVDGDGKKHIVWFENSDSVKSKEAYLQTVGLVKYGFWTYSYF